MLIDSHAHLTDRRLRSDLDEVLRRAEEAQVQAIVTVGTDPASSRAVAEMTRQTRSVVGTVGVHPHDAKLVTEDVLAEMAELAQQPGIVAIGETGLDFHRDLSPRHRQEMAFVQQIHLALDLDLPLVVHSREAHERTVAILAREGGGELRGVMHCFSGDMAIADRVLDLGLHIGIAGPVTYPNAETLRQVAGHVPLDRLLVETDCPYLAPQRYRGKRNEPAWVMYVAERIAQLRDLSFEELASATTENARELFRIPLA
ncbi:MAG: TatD family hydrolase [Armatimonadota bacterium]|nr:TatD family hydrolase [Armatimonadota bacterium]